MMRGHAKHSADMEQRILETKGLREQIAAHRVTVEKETAQIVEKEKILDGQMRSIMQMQNEEMIKNTIIENYKVPSVTKQKTIGLYNYWLYCFNILCH